MIRLVEPVAALTPDEMVAVVVAIDTLLAAPPDVVEIPEETPRWRFSGRPFGTSRRFA